MSGRNDGEEHGRGEAWGRASGNGQVYQSRANQYVTHIHIAEAHTRTAHEARQRADVVVQVLVRAVGEWAARCQELEEQVRRARAEGRAEAQAEFAEKLKDAELRVMRAQSTMRQAEEERARAETLLAQAQEELARRRREAERDAEREVERDAVLLPESPGPARDQEDTEQFSGLLERAEAELGAVREELRLLGEEVGRGDGHAVGAQVIQGEPVQWLRTDEELGLGGAAASDRRFGYPAGSPYDLVPPQALDPPRWFLIVPAWVLCALPPCVVMVAVTAVRAAFASDASILGVVPFTLVMVLLSGAGFFLAVWAVRFVNLDYLDRVSEHDVTYYPYLASLVGSAVLFVVAFFTPLSWPGPSGGWGRGIASWVGVA
ncbi:hypothetical protein ACIA6T_01950 [Streptomyces sp. NPDC051740]|uniref:hypothetical protein n=1 Tax=Streptomyces sp. NPDC051740 TaxID=3365673 RepID=UPI0037BB4F4E